MENKKSEEKSEKVTNILGISDERIIVVRKLLWKVFKENDKVSVVLEELMKNKDMTGMEKMFSAYAFGGLVEFTRKSKSGKTEYMIDEILKN